MRFLAAIQFLTLLPVRIRRDLTPEDLAGSTAFFPLVGLLLGVLLAGVAYPALVLFPQPLVSPILIAFLAFLTGALHLDGFADTADGMFSGKSPERKLAIMKDSHIGTMGVVALILVLLLKVSFLGRLPREVLMRCVILFPCVGRCCMVIPAYVFSYARKEGGTGEAFVNNLTLNSVVPALLTGAAAAVLLLGTGGILSLAAGLACALLVAGLVAKSIGGVTGDVLGAADEISETVFLVALFGFHAFGVSCVPWHTGRW